MGNTKKQVLFSRKPVAGKDLLSAKITVQKRQPFFGYSGKGENEHMKQVSSNDMDLLAMAESVLDVLHGGISITDRNGIILRLGKSCQELYGIDGSYVGKHISILEEEGILKPCLSLLALEQRKQISMVQPDKQGNPLLVTATPIFAPGTNTLLCTISYCSWEVKNFLELKEKYERLKLDVSRSDRQLQVLKSKYRPAEIVINSVAMERVSSLVDKLVNEDVVVTILGEAGSGKANLAKYLHQKSSRKDQPFGQLNCSVVKGKVLEDELFGCLRQDKATGEDLAKTGMCQVLNGGTLLLENIENIDTNVQNRLLHLLKSHSFYMPGEDEPVQINLHIIVTSCLEPTEMVRRLHPEFFYHLNIATIQMPSLKMRKEDICGLVETFLKHFNEKYHKLIRLSDRALDALKTYSWPGNITELKCFIQQLVLTAENELIQPYHLPDTMIPFSVQENEATVDLKEYLTYHEKRLVLQAYDKCKTSVGLAKYLGISQPSAVRKLQKYLGPFYKSELKE